MIWPPVKFTADRARHHSADAIIARSLPRAIDSSWIARNG
jgi:hypothetical protein